MSEEAMSDDTPDVLTEQEREALADQVAAYRRSLYVNGQRLRHRGPDALFALVESILAARVAAERERADARVAAAERGEFVRLETAEKYRARAEAAEQARAEVEAERDYHRARADVLLAKVSGGVQLRGRKPGDYWAEWHRTHCAAAEAASDATARLAKVRAVLDASCHHCGRLPEDDDDHTCPCPLSDSECLEHTTDPVVSLLAVRAALGGEATP